MIFRYNEPVPDRVFIIAEAGVNHDGDADQAFALVDVAAEAGADAVKFQTFKADKLVTRTAVKAAYQADATGAGESQFQMLQRLELSLDLHHRLKRHAEELGLSFMSTAFEPESLRFLVQELGLRTLKIPSGELTNGPFLLEHARAPFERLLVSTGMANLAEVEQALQIIAFGLAEPVAHPTAEAVAEACGAPEIRRLMAERVCLLHCTSEYPAAPETVNLRAMETLKQAFQIPVGYSDHTQGIAVSTAAAALGARVIEKHFTLDRSLPGPDHKASLEPRELKAMIEAIRTVELSLGDGGKRPQAGEWAIARVARKSLVAAQVIEAGELFSETNLGVLRPGNGRSPMDYWQLLGKPSGRCYQPGDLISD